MLIIYLGWQGPQKDRKLMIKIHLQNLPATQILFSRATKSKLMPMVAKMMISNKSNLKNC